MIAISTWGGPFDWSTKVLIRMYFGNRYSLEYLDKDDMNLAHLVGGVDAVIKVSQGWTGSSSPLKLISLKSSN